MRAFIFSSVAILSLLSCRTRDNNDSSTSARGDIPTVDGRTFRCAGYKALPADYEEYKKFRYKENANSREYNYDDDMKFAKSMLDMRKASTPFLTKVRLEELSALQSYAQNLYNEINAAASGDSKYVKLFGANVAMACSGLAKFPDFKDVTYSGRAYRTPSLKTRFVVGQPYSEAGFISSSASEGVARGFVSNVEENESKVLLEIRSKFSKQFWNWSGYGELEQEVLIPAGVLFNVRAVRTEGVFTIVELVDL